MAVDEIVKKVFHDSLDRACASGTFMDIFYQGFINSSIDIEKIFSNTDMEHLKRKLKSSLHMMTMLIDQTPGMDMYMGHLARVHGRYDIPPTFFDIWMECLISAVSVCDNEYDQQAEDAWREVVGRGILIMQQGAEAEFLADEAGTSA